MKRKPLPGIEDDKRWNDPEWKAKGYTKKDWIETEAMLAPILNALADLSEDELDELISLRPGPDCSL